MRSIIHYGIAHCTDEGIEGKAKTPIGLLQYITIGLVMLLAKPTGERERQRQRERERDL